MIDLPPMPRRIAALQRDKRGYPVPKFVVWVRDPEAAKLGKPGAYPDFRFARSDFRARAFKTGLCWICGEKLGVHRVYAIGPMCVINRVTSEPACHRDCATFAAMACPFLIRPRQKRNRKSLTENVNSDPGATGRAAAGQCPFEAQNQDAGGGPHLSTPGLMIDRNPGCVALYETGEAEAFHAGNGWLIRLGKPDRIDWWAEGRQATRAEIQASIDGGFPLLLGEAMKDGQEAVDDLTRLTFEALKLLPAA